MAYEEYEDDVLTVDYDTSIEEDDEMPTQMHGYVQLQLLFLLRQMLYSEYRAMPPVTFQGVTQQYTPDVCIYRTMLPTAFAENALETEPPFIAIEIISPSQTIGDMVKKCVEIGRAHV